MKTPRNIRHKQWFRQVDAMLKSIDSVANEFSSAVKAIEEDLPKELHECIGVIDARSTLCELKLRADIIRRWNAITERTLDDCTTQVIKNIDKKGDIESWSHTVVFTEEASRKIIEKCKDVDPEEPEYNTAMRNAIYEVAESAGFHFSSSGSGIPGHAYANPIYFDIVEGVVFANQTGGLDI